MFKSNEKFSSASVASTESAQSKTLSRNALYAPLVAYEQTQVEPTAYMGNQKAIPSSLKESALSSFLQSIGEDYHRNRATGADPKNNGSRPLSVSDMDDRIRQRAVTLVGGGVNSAMASSSRKPCAKAKGRKRPRRKWNEVESILAKNDASVDSLSFLRDLNDRWNAYMLKLLNIDSKAIQKIEAPIIKSRLAVARKSIDLAGAHIHIKQCTQKIDLTGMLGVLLGETNNTWSVVILSSKRREKRTKLAKSGTTTGADAFINRTESKGHGDPKSTPNTIVTSVHVVVVPKRGSSLDIILPLPSQMNERQERGNEELNGEKAIIMQAAKSIFITLHPNSQS
jgi:hypothetical protein